MKESIDLHFNNFSKLIEGDGLLILNFVSCCLLDGWHKGTVAFDLWYVKVLIELIKNVDIELAILIKKHLVGFLDGIKVITFIIVDEAIQILSGNLIICGVLGQKIKIKLVIG